MNSHLLPERARTAARINHVFAPVMDGDAEAAQADYVPLEPVRDDVPTQPALVALPVPSARTAARFVSYEAIEASLPDAVGAFVEWLVERSGWTVSERAPAAGDSCAGAGPPRRDPLPPLHELGRPDVTRPYVEALEARQVPHLLVGGRSFHEREEVDALRVALCAIEWPDDELSIYATLRGAFFAFPDHQLLAYRNAHGGRLNPITAGVARPLRFAHGEPTDLEAIEDALRLLRVAASPTQSRARAGHASRPCCGRRARTLASRCVRAASRRSPTSSHVVELARQYEASEGASFRGFVQQFLDETHTEAGRDTRSSRKAPTASA